MSDNLPPTTIGRMTFPSSRKTGSYFGPIPKYIRDTFKPPVHLYGRGLFLVGKPCMPMQNPPVFPGDLQPYIPVRHGHVTLTGFEPVSRP